jgi:hypothetical protein
VAPPSSPLDVPLDDPLEAPLDVPLDEPPPDDPSGASAPPSGPVLELLPLQPTPMTRAVATARPRHVFKGVMRAVSFVWRCVATTGLASSSLAPGCRVDEATASVGHARPGERNFARRLSGSEDESNTDVRLM